MSRIREIPRPWGKESTNAYFLRLGRYQRRHPKKAEKVAIKEVAVKKSMTVVIPDYETTRAQWEVRSGNNDKAGQAAAQKRIEAAERVNDVWEGVYFDPDFFSSPGNVNNYLKIPRNLRPQTRRK